MPLYKDRKCLRCGKWDFTKMTTDEYTCKECKRKEKESELEAIFKASGAVKWE